jgi:hypothetical protein
MISRFLIGLALLICFAGCEKRRSEATVIGKEYIAPAASAASPSVSPKHPKLQTRGGDDAEITVDSYVMKRSVRGTGLDPRALKDEQWLLKIRTTTDGRTFNVPTDQDHFHKLKLGSRVLVEYHTGKYTGSIWAAEIVD